MDREGVGELFLTVLQNKVVEVLHVQNVINDEIGLFGIKGNISNRRVGEDVACGLKMF